MRGRKPTPPERSARLGNPSHRPLPEPVAIVQSVSVPKPPDHLLGAGKELWTLVHRFAATWVNATVDGPLLLVACEIADDRERLKHVLLKEGHFQRLPIMTSKGDIVGEEIKIHPARRELRMQDANFTRVLGQLGLTPTDRSRLKLTEVQAENEYEKWRNSVK